MKSSLPFRLAIPAALMLAVTACASNATEPAEPFSFVVIGDAPYSPPDDIMLADAVRTIKQSPPPFIIHIGDYKGGGVACTDDHDQNFAKLIADLAPTPVFYTPGDNEWTDCDRFKDPATGKQQSDLERWKKVKALFFSAPPQGAAAFGYASQQGQPENARWRYKGVQFVTLHVTGTNNGRDWVTGDPLPDALAAVTARDKANLAWLKESLAAASDASILIVAMQADLTDVDDKSDDVMCTDVAPNNKMKCDGHTDLRAAIRDAANQFGKPVLLIHGDTAPFTFNQTFSGEEAATLWRLNAAGDSGIGRTGLPFGTRDVTAVTITPGAAQPFAAQGMLTGKKPKKK